MVAYKTDGASINELPWDYPDCHLVELLHGVVLWTHESDHWGRGFSSSKSIRQAGPGAFHADPLTDVQQGSKPLGTAHGWCGRDG